MVGTGKLSRVLGCTFYDIWFLVQLTNSNFFFDFELLQSKLDFLQKRQVIRSEDSMLQMEMSAVTERMMLWMSAQMEMETTGHPLRMTSTP